MEKVRPLPYQVPEIAKTVKALRGSSRRALIDMATALGKTLVSAFVAKKFGAKRILFLAHNNYILKGSADEFCRVYDEKTKMVIYNGFFKGNAQGVDIVFASWQTMGRRLKNWKHNHFDLIIVDEAHHTNADTYRPVVDYFTGAKLGITATPNRADDSDIRDVFGKEVVKIPLEDAIARKLLPRIEYHVVIDESLDEHALQKIMKEIKAGKKRFTMAEVNRRIFIKKRDVEITRIINGYDEKALVFCSSITRAERLKKTLKLSKTFHSSTDRTNQRTWNKNQKTLDQLHDGIIRRVCAVNAFNEGLNVPSIGLVAFCRVTESLTIFRQQLGRGLRRGKEKLIVLDFVGNLERIKMIMEMMNRISDLYEKYTPREEREREGYARKQFEVSGKGFEFTFSSKVVDVMKVLEHCEREFYPTWQEASEVVQEMVIDTAISGINSYWKRYREDPRLPSLPSSYYPNFPGWIEFLGKNKKTFYSTWQEAAQAATKLGIDGKDSYKEIYKKDPRLPSRPDSHYSDFPGWALFLGGVKKKFYPTWQRASKGLQKIHISTIRQYNKRYKEDPRLPASPDRYYLENFPGWTVFLGGVKKKFYLTCQRASKAAKELGVTGPWSYSKKYKKDPFLPSSPHTYYSDFPGWAKFLGKK